MYRTRDELLSWARKRGLRPSRVRGVPCLHWVAKGRRCAVVCGENVGKHRWMDHATSWIKDGKPVLVCEPYVLTTDDLRNLQRAVEHYGLKVRIHGGGSYGCGTICIELSRNEAGQREVSDSRPEAPATGMAGNPHVQFFYLARARDNGDSPSVPSDEAALGKLVL